MSNWPHTHGLWLSIKRNTSIAKIPPEESGVLAPPWDPLGWGPGLGRRVPTTSGCENQQGVCLRETKGCWKPRCPLKVPVHRVTCKHSLTLGSGWGAATREAPEIYSERLELCGFRVRDRGTPSIIPVLCPPPVKPIAGCHLSVLSPPTHGQIWNYTGLVKSARSTPVTPWNPTLPIPLNIPGCTLGAWATTPTPHTAEGSVSFKQPTVACQTAWGTFSGRQPAQTHIAVFLGQLLRICGPRGVAPDLNVLWVFCRVTTDSVLAPELNLH